jgi:hypothetical protein
MNTLKNNLEQREKPELIAIIQHMLRQEELDAKGNQPVGDVPTQNIYGFSPRIVENASHHKGQ